ncbi:MAG: hypothetical protein QCI82_11245 [Candidatus Thermoplasmatota archaeon]|nr:hypothetical protein [Candidatus Thermoplasmatota archaeon]
MKIIQLFIIIILIISICGCISFDKSNKKIVVMYIKNENHLNLSNVSNKNVLLFSLFLNIERENDRIQLDFFNTKDDLEIKIVKNFIGIEDFIYYSKYHFTFKIENINNELNIEKIIGVNNIFQGFVSFNNNESIQWSIDKKYNMTYEINVIDENLLTLYLFPNNIEYFYKLYFLFYV